MSRRRPCPRICALYPELVADRGLRVLVVGGLHHDASDFARTSPRCPRPAPMPFGDEIGRGHHITYGLVEGDNTYVVRAIDSAGNASGFSAPYTLNVHLCA